ncbi:MAG: BMP family protein [Lachnospirales bacterium]
MKRFTKMLLLGAIACMSMAFTACGGKQIEVPSDIEPAQTNEVSGADTTGAKEPEQKIAGKMGLILTTAGLGDKNFNDMSYQGMQMAKEQLGVDFDYAEPKAVSDYETVMRQYAESGDYELIITLSSDQEDALRKVATDFPNQMFSIIDAKVELPNVNCVFTFQQEQTFLNGVLAGLATTDTANFKLANPDKHVGIIIGMDNPTQQAAQAGFVAGAKFVDKETQVDTTTIGSFTDPAKGITMASSMYATGADIIHHFCGATGLGIFTASKNENKYAIGAGMSQNPIEPDHIISTSERKVYEIVFNELKKMAEGQWTAGIVTLGLVDNAVGYTFEGSNVKIPDEIVQKMEAAKKYIVDNKVEIPAKLEDVDAWVEIHNISKIK